MVFVVCVIVGGRVLHTDTWDWGWVIDGHVRTGMGACSRILALDWRLGRYPGEVIWFFGFITYPRDWRDTSTTMGIIYSTIFGEGQAL